MYQKLTECPNFTWYLAEKLTKFPNFTWFLPGNARISHDNCPKNISRIFRGERGTCPSLLPPISYAHERGNSGGILHALQLWEFYAVCNVLYRPTRRGDVKPSWGWEMAKHCDVINEYYDHNTGLCSLCADACNHNVWQTDVCSTNCAGLFKSPSLQ